ncbi:MAG: chloride channel protein [Caldisericia bacterium]
MKTGINLKKDEVSYWVDIVLAIIFGLAAAIAVRIFDWVVDFSTLFDPEKMNWFFVILIPTAGGFVVGLVAFVSKMKASGGVVDVIAHIFTRKHIISKPKALLKPVLSAVSIISGNPVGSEAPVVMLGAQIASFSSNLFRLPRARKRMLIACGSAAGIASAFLSPLAAIAFALEIILMEFTMYEFGMLALSTGSAYIGANLLKSHPIIHVPHMEVLEWTNLWLFILLGIICAVVAVFWTKILHFLEHFADKYPKSIFWGPIVAGFSAGVIAIFVPQIWGPGYHQMSAMFVTKMPFYAALGIVFAKLIGTSMVLGLGGAEVTLPPVCLLVLVSGL